jgi:hypothetical protein
MLLMRANKTFDGLLYDFFMACHLLSKRELILLKLST